MLCAVKRNMAFVDGFLEKGGFLEDRDMELLATIRKLYAQQKETFDEKKHRVAERIVSVTQPYVRPIVRGKVKDPVEFGAKYDVSVYERGHARLEHVDFEPYNECTILRDVVNRYKERTGHYPKRVLVDLVYRTKENRTFCEERGIEMQKRKPGWKPKDAKERRKLEKKERRNDADRIDVERFFSVEKRCCGAGLIMTKLSKTTLGSMALSVLVANLFGVQLPRLFFCSISWTRPTVCRRVICWKSRTRRHDGLGHRHPQATHGRRAARNPAPAAGSRLLWADTNYGIARGECESDIEWLSRIGRRTLLIVLKLVETPL